MFCHFRDLLNCINYFRLISYAYGVIGVIEAFAGFFTYVVIMEQNGFLVKDLIDIRKQWVSSFINDLSDSYGQEWVHAETNIAQVVCNLFLTLPN